jgi:2-polyprenyl-3-methyl-5-hydroxy-6-metoxy-1,4-benzoquinol methylase
MNPYNNEKDNQEKFSWERGKNYESYNKIIGNYQAVSCIENSTGGSLLDLACGDGYITSILSEHFTRIVGVDASGTHLEIARKRLPGIEFHEKLIEELDTNERFDTVSMFNVLEHVIDPVFLLQKAASFLKEDGTMIVHVPNANAINRRIAVLMGTLETCEELSPFDINIAGHRRAYTMKSFVEEIENAGLRIEKTGGVFYKMLSTPQIDWFLKNGPWEEGGFGWGRVGGENKDWRNEFCRACYEIGKEQPEDCNIIYACVKK